MPAISAWTRTLVISVPLVLAACSSLPTDVQRTPSHAIETTRDTLIGRQLAPLVEQHPGQSGFLTLLAGEAAFAARIRLIREAEKSIDTQYYIWHDDLTGRSMYNELLQAADRGGRVRILLDDLDTAGKDKTLRLIDAHPRVEIRLFNPFANRDRRAADFLTDTRRINHRMHNKTLTADNQATIFGGRNIGDEYFAADDEVGFGDMDALAVGPITAEVSAQFDLYWNSKWAYPITAFAWDTEIGQDEVDAFRASSDAYLAQARQSEYAAVVRQYQVAVTDSIANLDFVWSEWLLAYDQPGKADNREVSADTHLAPKLRQGMEKTTRDLIIVSPYFVPGERFTADLVGLVNKGVRVRILTNSLAANDVPLVHAGYMRYRKDLVAGGVELYEYRATAKRQGKRSRIGASRASLHAKFFGFDEHYLFIGSFNLDARSATINTELGAYFASPVQAKNLSEVFDRKFLQVAYRLELDDKGGLEWVTLIKGQEIRLDKEPNTTAWQRFNIRLLSIIVPESQL